MKLVHYTLVASVIVFSACSSTVNTENSATLGSGATQLATLAGGCFWCMEKPFEEHNGVIQVLSGYAGGTTPDPTYEEVSAGTTKHREVVQITFDPTVITYEQLLEIFWRQIDPTDNNGQFVDRGFQYTSAIFYHDLEQKRLAEESKVDVANLGLYTDPLVTPIIEYTNFYPAEEYHQDYYKKNPLRYSWYRNGSGRDQFLESIWGDQ